MEDKTERVPVRGFHNSEVASSPSHVQLDHRTQHLLHFKFMPLMCFFIKQGKRKHVKNGSPTLCRNSPAWNSTRNSTLLHEAVPETHGPNAGSPAVTPTQRCVSQSLQLLHESSSRAVGRKPKRLCHFPLRWIYVGFCLVLGLSSSLGLVF